MKTILILFTSFLLGIASVQAQWVSQTVPPNTGGVKDIDIINANDVWALGSGTAPYFAGTVLRTTNGGTTWNEIPINAAGITGQFMIYSLDAIDANIAYATGQDYTPATGGMCRILKTIDAGQTWTIIPGIYLSPMSFASFVQFFDMNNGLIFGDNQEIYTTSNGGNTWTAVPAINMPPNAANLDASLNLRAVVGNTIWVPVNGMRIYKSTDKGLTWTVLYPPITTPVFLDNIAFQDANNGLANLANNLIRTTDGGQSWTPVTRTGPYFGQSLTHIPGSPSSYISYSGISTFSGMSISNDNGLTWSLLDVNAHYSAEFLNNQLGWSGGKGVIYKSGGNILGTSKEICNANSFFIYPNPGNGIFNIMPSDSQPFTLEVYDLTGRKIMQQKGNLFGKNTLDISAQKKGIYQLHILRGEQRIIEKIVLQ